MYENEDKMKSDILEKGNKDKNSEMEKMKNVKNKQVIHFHSLKKYRFYRFCKRGDSGDFIPKIMKIKKGLNPTGSILFCYVRPYLFAFTCAKYSLQSLMTTGLNNATAIKFGIAISPFNVSAIAHASESSTVPAIQAKRQKIT